MSRDSSAIKRQGNWKVAAYVRLSREDGNEQSLSVLHQKERLLSYIETSDEALDLVDFYVDDGYTGTDSHRDGFQRMLHDIGQRRINCVLVKDPSRLSRNYIEAGTYMEQLFVSLNVRFISLELPALDSFLFPEQMNSIIVPLQNVINDEYCRQASIKIRSAFHSIRRQGKFNGGFPPYGYRKDPQDKYHFVIDNEAAEVVRDIFTWYVREHLSKRGIVHRLNDLGILAPSVYKRKIGQRYFCPGSSERTLWTYATVDTVLKNADYIGHMVQGRYRVASYKVHKLLRNPQSEWVVVKNMHEPIVDEATFQMAQEIQQRSTRTRVGETKLSLFAGFLRCADCGRSMARRPGNGVTYYVCGTYANQSKQKCSRHSIREDDLTEAVLKALQIQVSLIEDVQQATGRISNASEHHRASNRVMEILRQRQQEHAKNTEITDGLYLDWKHGDISRDEYLRLKAKLEVKAEELRKAICKIQDEVDALEREKQDVDPYLVTFLKHKNITSLERGILNEVIKTIRVFEEQRIEIEFTYSDQFLRILEGIEVHQDETDISRED